MTVNNSCRFEQKISSSRFIGILYPVQSASEAESLLQSIRKAWYDATHHCYAWRIRPTEHQPAGERSSDDGEPAGTAGKPILQMLQASHLENTLAVVIRYFGGTKLGTGGLVRAYGDTIRETINLATIEKHYFYRRFTITIPFSQMAVLMRIFTALRVSIEATRYEEQVTYTIGVLPGMLNAFQTEIIEQFRNQVHLEPIQSTD